MKRIVNLSVVLSVLVFSSVVFAAPASWLSTRYRPDLYSTGSWYRSPVTDGHLDVRVLAEEVSFTDAEFSIRYDSSIVHVISTANVWEVAPGLTLVSVTTEPLEGTWKESTITLSGNISIGSVQYESEATFLRVRFIPHAEGTMPITLWPSYRYPESYYNCSLTLLDNGVEVEHGPKDWNDGTTLFAFTDKTSASVIYNHDINFGTPLVGYLQVVYNDDSVEAFHVSDHDRGITIDPEYGAYFITAQPNAASHTMILPGYGESGPLNLTGGGSWNLMQPDRHLFVKEVHEGFYGIQATADDIVLTVGQPGIGVDFENADYAAAIAGSETGIQTKTFAFEYVDDDTILLTIEGGLEPDWHYELYVFKDDVILGRSWFGASLYYPVTITVEDEQENPLSEASVSFEIFGMDVMIIEERTDENGRAFFEMPGMEWGQWYQYRVIAAGYENYLGDFLVYDEPVAVTVTMVEAAGVNLEDFALFASWWDMQGCYGWDNDYCGGADMNLDGRVDTDDLLLWVARWLKNI